MKQPKLSTLENNAWDQFSKFIRLRDCLKFGSHRMGKCFTCGEVKDFSELDAGHYVKSTHRLIKFHEQNVHAQCRKCNRFMGGNEAEYTVRLIDKYGRELVDYLLSQKGKTKKFTRSELIDLKNQYKKKYEELCLSNAQPVKE
jgi:hypothetical protein